MVAPLFRLEAMRGCSCTGSNYYYSQGSVDAYVRTIRSLCNELLAENAKLKSELKDIKHETV